MTLLCQVCSSIFKGVQFLHETRPHHRCIEDVQKASTQGCYICRIIALEVISAQLTSESKVFEWYLCPPRGVPDGWLNLTIEMMSKVPDTEGFNDASVDGASSDAEEDDEKEEELCAWSWTLHKADDAGEYVEDYQPPDSLDDPSLAELARSWLLQCRDHENCNRDRSHEFAPSRLLDLAAVDEEGVVKLRIAADTRFNDSYATLSHCWGKTKALKLTDDNVSDFCEGIRLGELPVSYREAIAVARWFNIRYLWIDSLCIIQDSRKDWLFEASRMGDVYKHSELNIAAAGASDNSQPCFSERDTTWVKPGVIPTKWEGEASTAFVITEGGFRQAEIDFSPLRQRAWVLQEVWLAPRVLNLGKRQMWWECFEFEACETYPNGIPEALNRTRRGFSRETYLDDPKNSPYLRYEELVQAYSSCALTFDTDRVMAFAGMAKQWQQTLGDEYIAGMFRSKLPSQLLWEVEREFGKVYRPKDWRAPSWSWLSVEGPLTLSYAPENAMDDSESEFYFLVDVVEVDLQFLDPRNPFGIMLAGRIVLEGCVVNLTFEPSWRAYTVMHVYGKGATDRKINLPEDDQTGTSTPGRPLRFSLDDPELVPEDSKFSCFAVCKYHYADHDWLECLMLHAEDDGEDCAQRYRRVGRITVRGGDMVQLFDHPSDKRRISLV